MVASPARIGPFVGGMNTYSGPSSIADNEAVELLNLDVDLDGSLTSRPGVGFFPPQVTTESSHILGTYRSTADVVYIIYAFETSGYAYNTSAGTWTSLGANVYTACVQYNDKLYLVQKPSGVTQGGQSWTPAGGVVAVASMPRGYSACVYKERMFISASRTADESSINRVKFSNPANPDTWTGTDYFDVNAGDGQDITKLYVFDSSIVIFKSDSTYVFAYESAPGKGQVQVVSATIGANNAYSVVEYENNLFTLHESNVYRISNWLWDHTNIKLPFEYLNQYSSSGANASSLSILGNRLLCRYYDKYYTLGFKTGAWARWEFTPRTNAAPNPSFEVDTSGWVRSNASFVTITRTTATKHSGVASADVSFTAAGQYVTTSDGVVAAAPGDVWTASIYAKGAGTFELSVIFTDGVNPLLVTYSGQIPLTAAYQRINVTATAPAGTTYVRARCYQRSNMETFNIDDLLLEETDMVKPYITGTVRYTPSEFLSSPNIDASIGKAVAYAGTYYNASGLAYTFIDKKGQSNEIFDTRLTTKAYDFGPSYSFKRLNWWGVDILAQSNIRFKVSPVVYSTPITWGQLVGVAISTLQTWGRPLDVTLDVTDSASVSNPAGYRTFIKLLKALRFRQVQFILEADQDGASTEPLRIFSLTAFVDAKETVSKQVS